MKNHFVVLYEAQLLESESKENGSRNLSFIVAAAAMQGEEGGLIEEFVTRPGTDTGYTRASLEDNVAMVLRQLDRGAVGIVYDEDTDTANIVPREVLARLPQDPGE